MIRSVRVLTAIGTAFGIITIVLGTVAIVTSSWIKVAYNNLLTQTNETVTYDLYQRCGKILTLTPDDQTDCLSVDTFRIAQGLEIAGLIILTVGAIVGITRNILIEKIDVYIVPLLFTIIGSILLLIGFLVYAKYVIEEFGTLLQIKVDLGYSMILMVVTCILGFGLTAFFSFNVGYIRRNNKPTIIVANE